jgi:hypothetical protein
VNQSMLNSDYTRLVYIAKPLVKRSQIQAGC